MTGSTAAHRTVSLLVLLALGGCTSARLLRVENDLLTRENLELRALVEGAGGRDATVVAQFEIEAVGRILEARGFNVRVDDDATEVTLQYGAENGSIEVVISTFPNAGVLYMATRGYVSLVSAHDGDSAQLMITQLATLNYEVILAKFQLDPVKGEVVVSVELPYASVDEATMVAVLERLIRVADTKRPLLQAALQSTAL
jgi:hypothetical protein